MAGRREPMHGHNWRVTAVVRGARLDADGLLCDFHLVEATLRDVVAPLHNRSLNEVAPFDALNPTAEHVAGHIGQRLAAGLAGRLPAGVGVERVSVTEAPGCRATWINPQSL